MASSPLRFKKNHHVRSISLPSRPHPIVSQFSADLCRVKSCEDASSSSSSMSNRLNDLQDLYDCLDNSLLMRYSEQTLTQEHQKKWVDEALDGYLRLLDVCSTVRDVISHSKQDVKELLSVLRRRSDAKGLGSHVLSRKKVQKMIKKCLKGLRSIKSKYSTSTLDNDHETAATVDMLNEVEVATLAVLESMLSHVGGSMVQARPSGWSLISKLKSSRVTFFQDEATKSNGFDNLDAALHSLIGQKTCKSDKITNLSDNVQNQLKNLELSIQDFEERLECLSRQLIKIRVFLLNILNQ